MVLFNVTIYLESTKTLTCSASLVEAYKKSLRLKQASTVESKEYRKFMATQLHEPRYEYSSDSLGLVDFNIEGTRGSTDIVRKFLQNRLPVRFLDDIGRERRELEAIKQQGELPSGTFIGAFCSELLLMICPGRVARINEQYRRHGRYISPSVDNFARIFFALVGGIFLLLPMIVLSFITSKNYLLLTTVLFVLVFSISLGLISKASNQELVAATAAYAAVLVVFVGNNIDLKH
jgi:hypothetical protein